jgi:hypothetical protein
VNPLSKLPSVTVSGILSDAWRLYRLLFRRSIGFAAVVIAVLTAVNVAQYAVPRHTGLSVLLGIAAVVLAFAGPVIIQGALIELVRNIHEGRRPAGINALLERVGECFWQLLKVSIIYGLGVGLGLVLFIVPGLIIMARWSLMAPLVVLENVTQGAAARSSSLVRGKAQTVLLALLVGLAVSGIPSYIVYIAPIALYWQLLFSFVWGSLTVPFSAYLFTVIYYRITDPERSVIDPAVSSWKSLWNGA